MVELAAHLLGNNSARHKIPKLCMSNLKATVSRRWWNWQTRMFEGHVAQALGVQIPLSAPNSRSEFDIEAALSNPTKRRIAVAEIPKTV